MLTHLSLRVPSCVCLADAFCAEGWDIGYSSMLHWAVHVRPFKDVFWSTPYQPGSPYEDLSLYGRVMETVLRGRVVFRDGTPPLSTCGVPILRAE